MSGVVRLCTHNALERLWVSALGHYAGGVVYLDMIKPLASSTRATGRPKGGSDHLREDLNARRCEKTVVTAFQAMGQKTLRGDK
jgi:hypothetical protein